MSTMAYKAVLRARLPGVTNVVEHLAWMREHVGEPVELDGGWFTYGRERWEGPYFKECSWGNARGVELVLMESQDEMEEGINVPVEDLLRDIEHLRDMACSPVRFFVYSWYTGVDEPIEW
jgi:glycosyltransferase A (GT-A) superfamily protein (DUF2064 family)